MYLLMQVRLSEDWTVHEGMLYVDSSLADLSHGLDDEQFDTLSHHVLTMIASQSPHADFPRWLASAEARLLSLRLRICNRHALEHALDHTGFVFQLVAMPEYVNQVRRTFFHDTASMPRQQQHQQQNTNADDDDDVDYNNGLPLLGDVRGCAAGSTTSLSVLAAMYEMGEPNVLLKIPFELVCDIVKHRHADVAIDDGYAFLPQRLWSQAMVSHFMKVYQRRRHVFERAYATVFATDDRLSALSERVSELFSSLHAQQTLRGTLRRLPANGATAHSAQLDRITPDSIDAYTDCMPLCARHYHRILRQTHKLQHNGRMVYFNFLKSIGMSLTDAIRMIKAEFLRVISEDDWTKKKYEYYIRHMYGLEGRRKTMAAHSCIDVTSWHTACPFAQPTSLLSVLRDYTVDIDVQTDVSAHASSSPGGGCMRFCACAVPGVDIEDVRMREVTHPADYFEFSRRSRGRGAIE